MDFITDILGWMPIILLVAALFVLPGLLTIYNIVGFFSYKRVKKIFKRVVWFVTIVLGSVYSHMYINAMLRMDALWSDQLYNDDLHQALWEGGVPSFIVLVCVGIIGLFILCIRKTSQLSPIVIVLCISAMYITAIELIVYCIQLAKEPICLPLMLAPVNYLIIVMTIIREKIMEWNENPEHQSEVYNKEGALGEINRLLIKAETWPVFALVFMIPLLGILLGVMSLFGQTPDKVIRTWTETADWTFSTKIPPQNLTMDEHYLCTVAAGGHPEVVKPVRMGERHGHRVVVNRQLMIANAFENVLEEKTPRFHRAVRNFYDKYGFPVADYIRPHKAACDITYFVMKPLEWLFLLVLYTVDANPENRIAVQYLPKRK